MHAEDERRKIREQAGVAGAQVMKNTAHSNFYSGRGGTAPAQQLDALIGALDQTSQRDIRTPGKPQTADPMSNYSTAPLAQGNKNVSLLKAELVRNNLVTRTDLMKLYQPPVKKSALLENNPFFNKSIVKSGDGLVSDDHQAYHTKLVSGAQEGILYKPNSGEPRMRVSGAKSVRKPSTVH